MRKFALLAVAAAACSGDDGPSADALTGNHPEPVVIPGGGLGSGAIDGVVNVYAIDDVTRQPIKGATVRVGSVEGTTDAEGLFVAEGVVGAQTVVVAAPSYRAEMWVGANAANMTFDLHLATPSPPQATLSGTVANLSSISVPMGHGKLVAVGYSHDEAADDATNNLKTPADANRCLVFGTTACNFSVLTRAGTVGLIAAILDYDTNNTPLDGSDDTVTLIGYATRTGITVTAGVNQSGQDLTLVPMGSTVVETVDYGTPPAALTTHVSLIGIELADGSGILQVPLVTGTTLMMPALSNFPGSMYRLTGVAQSSAMPPTTSFLVRRHLTSATLSAGMWTEAPTNVSLSRTHASWTNSPTGTIHTVEYTSGSTAVLNISSFDGSSAVDIPTDIITLPAATIDGKVNALTAIGIDLGDLAIDRDREKITGAASAPAQVN